MLQTMLAMGVYLDDQAMFDRGVEYYLGGKGNGAIGSYFKPSGQCQESGQVNLGRQPWTAASNVWRNRGSYNSG